jgi:hypothetical protein
MQTNFRFATIEGLEVTSSTFNLVPISYPTISGSFLAIGDPLSYSGSLQTLDLVDTIYKVELNLRDSSNWYMLHTTASSVTASANIISGSYATGSICAVTFNLIDHVRTPSAIKTIVIDPINSNIGFNEYFILEDSIAKTTDGTGQLVVNLVPGYYNVSFKGARKTTRFQILVPNDTTARAIDIIVRTSLVSNKITVNNQFLVGYTAQSSDARYAYKWEELPVAENTLFYSNTLLHDNTMSVYLTSDSKWYDVTSKMEWNRPYLSFATSSYTGSAYSSALIESASFAVTASYANTFTGTASLAAAVISVITTNAVPDWRTPTKGTMIYHTGSNTMYVFNGYSWKSASFI